MRTKWLLIALPLGILALLFQSVFWVPTYASQAEGNPGRLVTYVRGSLTDAKQLNPIVASDRPTFEVIERNVFEGLLDEDENRRVTTRLASSYETTEEAFLAVLPERRLPDGTPASAQALLAAVRGAWQEGRAGGVLGSIRSVELVPPFTKALRKTVLVKNATGKEDPVDVELTVEVPERVKLTLSKVETRLFKELQAVVGPSYFEGSPFDARFKAKKPEQLALARPHFLELLQIGEHNPILTFRLRPNVRWHDGHPFTAADVKFSYEAAIDPRNASPRGGLFDPIQRVEIVDDLTVRVIYKRLYAQGPIDWAITQVVPKHLLDETALEREKKRRRMSDEEKKKLSLRTTEFNRHPIGTGPFRFAEWRPDQFIHITRNENYWGRKAEYRDVYYRVIPDYLTMELELQAGALDIYDALPHQAGRYRRDPNYQVIPWDEGAYTYIGYNSRRPLFQDVRVRRALGMAIDVDAIIRYVISGEGKRATGVFYSNSPYRDPDIKPLPYDPAAAADLLAQAGWRKNARGVLEKDGKVFEFTLVTNNGNPQRKAIMQVAQEAWKKLGIECKVQAFEWTVFLEEFVHKRNFDAIVLGWASGAIMFDKYLYWHSSQVGNYKYNYSGLQDPKVDELLIQIQETYDEAERLQLTRKLHRTIFELAPMTFLYEPRRPLVVDRRVAVVEHTPDGKELITKLRMPRSGDSFLFFTKWRKLASTPVFSEQQ
jgi:ABC-type transport system substrate-binding protein